MTVKTLIKTMLPAITVGLVCGAATASTTCLRSKTVMFEIQRSTAPTSVTSDASAKTFEVTYDYNLMPGRSPAVNTLTGLATCNEITTNTAGTTASAGDHNTYLRNNYDNSDTGTRCWCSFTGPITSWWVYLQEFSTEDGCATGCATACANAIRSNSGNFRTAGMYNAIW